MKSDGARFFMKIRIWPKRAKNEVFGIFLKIASLLFFDFLHDVRGIYGVKSGRIRFFGKIRIWPKIAKTDKNPMKFSKFSKIFETFEKNIFRFFLRIESFQARKSNKFFENFVRLLGLPLTLRKNRKNCKNILFEPLVQFESFDLSGNGLKVSQSVSQSVSQ